MRAATPFRAFVSYAHADAAFAARLQRRLETYRLPKRLADKVAPMAGQATGRLGPVFRDRADLSAAVDLSEAVRAAIAASSALVVVASPDAAASRWVTREIELFRELHPEAPVLVAVTRGEPAEVLPEVLRRAEGREPLAADFRKEGDGDRLAFLKIVAGLAELPLDALVQRDAQRQVRRVTAVTLGAAVLVVVMALLLVMALRAREEAERRRAGAEGIIEFMETGLRSRLRATGDLEVMTAVNERALQYFDDQEPWSRPTDDSLLLKAQVLHAFGEDHINRSNAGDAGKRLSEAYQMSYEIMRRRPDYPRAIFTHAQSEFWLGLARWREGDRQSTTQHWNAYRRLAEALAGVEGGSARSLLEQGYAEGNLCELNHSGRFDLAAAARHCAESVRFQEAALQRQHGVVRAAPEHRFAAENDLLRTIEEALANRYGWAARIQLAQGEYTAALASREAEAKLIDGLLKKEPKSAELALRRSWADIGKADVQIRLKSLEMAVRTLDACLRRFGGLFGRNSQDIRFAETRLRIHLFLAKARRLMSRDYSVALAEAERAGADLTTLNEGKSEQTKKIWNHIWEWRESK